MKIFLFALTLFSMAEPLSAQKTGLMLPVGHKKVIRAMSVSPNGQMIASADREGKIIIWSVSSAQELRTFKAHKRTILSIAFSPKSSDDPVGGKYLLSGGEDKQLKLWETATGKELLSISYRDYIESVVFSPDGKQIMAAVGADLHIIAVDTGKEIQTLSGHTKDIIDATYNPDGTIIATGSQDHLVKLWDVKTGTILNDFEGHDDDVEHVAFHSNGKYLLSGGDDDHIILWDVAKKKEKMRFKHKLLKEVKFDPKDQIIWTLGLGGIKKWDYSGKELILFDAWKDGVANTFQFVPQQDRLIVNTYGRIDLVDKEDGMKLRAYTGLVSAINQIHISSNGQQAVFYGSSKNIVRWDLQNGRLINTFRTTHTGSVSCTALSPRSANDAVGGQYFATGSRDKTIKLWDTRSGNLLQTFNGHTGVIKGLSFSPDAKYIISSANDYTWKIWEVSTGSMIKSVETRSGWPEIVLFSPNSKLVVSSHSDNVIRIWDRHTGAEIQQIPCVKDIIDLKMSPSCKEDPEGGKYLVSYNMDKTYVWDSKTWTELLQLQSTSTRSGFVDFVLGNSQVILSGSKKIRLYDIQTGEKLREHATAWPLRKATFSAKGNFTILLSSEDDFARFFDLSTWTEKAAFVAFDNAKDWLFVTPDKYYYATKDASKSIHYTVDSKLYSFDQFDLQYNRPDIVIERIGMAPQSLVNAYEGAYTKRLNKMGFSTSKISKFVKGEFDTKQSAPILNIDDQYLNVETDQKDFSFKIEANDPSGFKIRHLLLSVNGVPLYGIKGKILNHVEGTTLKIEIPEIRLSNGKNTIRVQVMNDNGVTSLAQSLQVLYTGAPNKSNLYIVTIGVSKYQDSEMNLDYAAKDASDLTKLLQRQKKKYNNIYVQSFLDENATTTQILQVKEQLMKSKVDDEVVLFVAGHGLLDDQLNYYIATHDVDFAAPAAKGLPYENLENLLDGIPARKKLMMIDACHSGEIDQDETVLTTSNTTSYAGVKSRGFKNKTPQKMGLAESFQLMQKLFNDLRTGNGAVVISAASGLEFSLESSQWNNGVFTYAVLEGLTNNKCDQNKDGNIQVSEIRDYVFDRVVELTNGKQHPTSRRENLENDFVVW